VSVNRTVLYPALFDTVAPPRDELVRRLLVGGFMTETRDPRPVFEVTKGFMTVSEIDIWERQLAAGGYDRGPRVHVATHDKHKIFASPYIQYIDQIVSPAGTAIGDINLAEDYLQQLHDDPDAYLQDPSSGENWPIRSLRFEVLDGGKRRTPAVGYGRVEISIDGYRSREDCRLEELSEIVGFALEYCYLAG